MNQDFALSGRTQQQIGSILGGQDTNDQSQAIPDWVFGISIIHVAKKEPQNGIAAHLEHEYGFLAAATRLSTISLLLIGNKKSGNDLQPKLQNLHLAKAHSTNSL